MKVSLLHRTNGEREVISLAVPFPLLESHFLCLTRQFCNASQSVSLKLLKCSIRLRTTHFRSPGGCSLLRTRTRSICLFLAILTSILESLLQDCFHSRSFTANLTLGDRLKVRLPEAVPSLGLVGIEECSRDCFS